MNRDAGTRRGSKTQSLSVPQFFLSLLALDNSTLQAMWKPAYDFLLTWSHQIGDSYRDVIQELHIGLDKMKNPITKRWKHLTGTLILVNSLDILRAAAFSPVDHDDFVI